MNAVPAVSVERNYSDWLSTYISLVEHTEAPKLNHFWAGVGAMAGALRRHVWIDHETFKWYPSFYIIFVAPPEVISKSVTAGVAMSLLEDTPGIHFGPDSITWQSLVTAFEANSESFAFGDVWLPMSALTFFSSELGLLLDFQDKGMINVLIDLWDGRKKFEKKTKTSGDDSIAAPFITMVACTTPAWIADNIPAIVVGGGFTSRCVFVYADKKERLIAHPKKHVPAGFHEKRAKLLEDLEHISTLTGEFTFSAEAIDWEETWYKRLWTIERDAANSNELKALQRRHTHLNKLAMILSISKSDRLCIEMEDFALADMMLRDTAQGYDRVFSQIGRSEQSLAAEKFVEYVEKKGGKAPYQEAYSYVHHHFPDFRQFEGVLAGLVRSGKVVVLGIGTPNVTVEIRGAVTPE